MSTLCMYVCWVRHSNQDCYYPDSRHWKATARQDKFPGLLPIESQPNHVASPFLPPAFLSSFQKAKGTKSMCTFPGWCNELHRRECTLHSNRSELHCPRDGRSHIRSMLCFWSGETVYDVCRVHTFDICKGPTNCSAHHYSISPHLTCTIGTTTVVLP